MTLLESPPPRSSAHAPPAPKLTLAGHLEELRRRLGIVLLTFVVAAAVSVTQVERFIAWLRRPAGDLLGQLAYFSPTEPLMAYLQVTALAALVLTTPVLLAHTWAFLRSGLTPTERAYGTAFVGWGSMLFVAGVAFAYTVVLPVSLHVLLGIGRGMLEPVISLQRYLGFVTTLLCWCGVIFELPAVLWLLAKVGIVTSEWLRQQRPYAILCLVILAAIMTPTTDAVSLLIMTGPLVLLYEISIVLARRAGAHR